MFRRSKRRIFFIACACVLLIFAWGRADRGEQANSEKPELMTQGDSLLGERNFDGAIYKYELLLERSPQDAEAWWKKEKALKAVEVANALIRKGDEAITDKQLEVAYDYFQLAREFYPYNPDDGYERNLGVFEMAQLQTSLAPYIEQLLDLKARQDRILTALQNGEDVKSKGITQMIEELYPLAQQVYYQSIDPGRLSSPEAIEYYKEKEQLIEQVEEEFVNYGIFPTFRRLGFDELDEYVQNVQIKFAVYGDGEGTIWDEYRLRHPDIMYFPK